MKIISFLITAFCYFSSFGIEPITLIESTFKPSAFHDTEYLFGFNEGDKIDFTIEVVKGKPIKEIELLELDGSSRFMDYKTMGVENKIVDVQRTGIFKFRILKSIGTKICKITVKRIPASEETQHFNSTVYWRTINDTIYSAANENYLMSKDTSFSDFYSSSPQISSRNALNGNRNYQIIDLDLPYNTVAWSFYIGTGSEGQKEYERSKTAFVNSAASAAVKIPGYGPMAALALTGALFINKVQGEDNVKYWFLSTYDDVLLFQNNQTFMNYKKGDVINEACQMKFPLKGKVYIAVLNDNTMDPIKLTIKATAVIVKENWGVREVEKYKVVSREEAYLKNPVSPIEKKRVFR